MSVSINGTGGITFADASTQSTGGYTGFRNRIINGAMMIDQRNNGAAVSTSSSFPVDRFFITISGYATAQQSSNAPSGFIDSVVYTQVTGTTVSASDQNRIAQDIEGLNCADFMWGTANAQPVTLSFWAKSSVIGNFGVGFVNNDNTRSYVASYTISAANTWEYKTITIAGDTTGTWLTNNGAGIKIRFDLGSGSNFQSTVGAWQTGEKHTFSGAASIAAVTGATFYISGVQLEKGSVATPFEFRPYGTELALCQRYFINFLNSGTNNFIVSSYGSAVSTTIAVGTITLPVTMRSQPTLSASNLATADGVNPALNVVSASIRTDVSTPSQVFYEYSVAAGLTPYRPYYVRVRASASGGISLSAEI